MKRKASQSHSNPHKVLYSRFAQARRNAKRLYRYRLNDGFLFQAVKTPGGYVIGTQLKPLRR